jgi:hypothetical protein
MTAVVARTAWKYRAPRVYRAFLLDAGHLSQSFLLIATALKLGAFCIGIVSDTLIEEELNLDGISETVLFVVGVGQPLKSSRGQTAGVFQDYSQPLARDGWDNRVFRTNQQISRSHAPKTAGKGDGEAAAGSVLNLRHS